MRKKLLLCLATVGMCAYMLTGCVTNLSEEKLPDPKAEQNQQIDAGKESGEVTPGTEDATGTEAGTSGVEADGQPTKKPAKEWSTPEDYRVVADYVVPESIANSEYDMEAALTCVPLKEAFAPYFKFGLAMSGYNAQTFAVESPEMQELLKYHCNTTTATNLMKPSYMLMQKECQEAAANGVEDPVLDFTVTDKMLAFCQENGIGVRGHTLVWHAQTPDWFFREGYLDDGAYVDAETMKYRLESYIRQMLTFCQDNYPGVVYCWDVVNECVEPADMETDSGWRCRTSGESPEGTNQWYDILGYEYVELAFTYARKYAAEDVALVYNEYNSWYAEKSFYIYELMEYLQGKGLVDALGMQCNLSVDSDLMDVYTSVAKYAELGLELQVTELNIVAEDTSPESYAKQAECYKKFIQYMLALDDSNGGASNITVVNIFSLMDGYLMYESDSNNYCVFDCNIEPKPNYYSMLEAVIKVGKHNPDVIK